MGANRSGTKRKQKLKETKKLALQRETKKLAQSQAGDAGKPSPAEQK